MDKVNLEEKLNLINEYWSPKILGEVNESYIKVAKLKGEFLWHLHEQEDEMFFVINGQLIIKFRDHETIINDGEFIVIPKGVEHMPVAREEVHVMLIEAKSTLNTGNVRNERTVETLEKI
ncbi:cupin domain-containing protein [Anaerocolumna sp. AGMB13025]|uniref:cupin domain-containing protein n=1 Tax=Anaerocolumna sp. AGMB13025 TaxID=3039116 RepID=UPI00241C491A|nr:cupin domain-containing protein [Anaerocolumna sp. AGMB13025]WFR55816.1 cupin domain-containing protein [Anaerocolumna sp. AGMB13025]